MYDAFSIKNHVILYH